MKAHSVANESLSPLAQRLRTARSGARFSQAQLAKRLAVTPSAVAQWEQAHGTSPALSHLESVASLCRVSFEWLAIGKGAKRVKGEKAIDEMPAVSLDTFAMNDAEELLLNRYRRLSPQIQHLFCALFERMTTVPRRRRR